MNDPQAAIPDSVVEAATSGDRAALEALVEHAYPLVRRWTLVQTGDAMEADDATQDALVKMVRRISTYRGSARFESWLYALTRNVVLDRVRRTRTRTPTVVDNGALASVAGDPRTAPDRLAEGRDLRRVLEAFFDELPVRQREAFDLVELQGRTAAEAAEMMDLAASSVRVHLLKARRRLRRRILEEHPEFLGEAS